MREFTKVAPTLWSSKQFRTLPSDDARYLYLYFLTSKHQNSAGAFELRSGYAEVDLQWDGERFADTRQSLIDADLIQFDESTDEYLINRWFDHNPPMNKNHRIGIVRQIEKLESEQLKEMAMRALEECSAKIAEPKPGSASYGNGNSLTETDYMSGRKR